LLETGGFGGGIVTPAAGAALSFIGRPAVNLNTAALSSTPTSDNFPCLETPAEVDNQANPVASAT
jgi:hypothetical protein